MDAAKKGWFSEINNELWPGQFISLEVEKVLHEEKTNYQQLLVFQSKHHGRVLVLDNIIQCTEFDEFSYQEMMSFVPLCAHPSPKNVLIIGGGDGGVAREVAKHPQVEKITQVEIDGKVIEASKRFLPFMAVGFSHPKLELIVGDGFTYMDKQRASFDVIITDSSDPIGPATNLFTANYFKLLAGALKPGGIICSQGGCIWNELEHVKQTVANCKQHFPQVRYALVSVPTYPSGQIGMVIASKDAGATLDEPKFQFTETHNAKLRYYHEAAHRASFVLPKFAEDALFKPTTTN